jgi:hypothetical protein
LLYPLQYSVLQALPSASLIHANKPLVVLKIVVESLTVTHQPGVLCVKMVNIPVVIAPDMPLWIYKK